MNKCKVIAVTNQKGGVGKTSKGKRCCWWTQTPREVLR